MKYSLYHAPANLDQRAIAHLNSTSLPPETRKLIRLLVAQNTELFVSLCHAKFALANSQGGCYAN